MGTHRIRITVGALIVGVVVATLLAPGAAQAVRAVPPPAELPSTWYSVGQGSTSTAVDLNDAGLVVSQAQRVYIGAFAPPVTYEYEALWFDTMTGAHNSMDPAFSLMTPAAVNESGRLVGTTVIGPPDSFIISWFIAKPDPSQPTGWTIEVPPIGESAGARADWSESRGYGINDLEVAVGTDESSPYQGWRLDLTEGPPAESIGTLGGTYSDAYDISNTDLIVGDSTIPSGATHAFLYDAATDEMTDLGTLPGEVHSSAVAINDSGTLIVGNGDQGFVYDVVAETMTALGPGTVARDVNDAGLVVGSVDGHAMIYDVANEIMTDVHDPAFGPDSTLDAIDNAGTMAAGAINGRAAILTMWAFGDTPRWHRFFEDIEWLAGTDVADGFEDGTFRPASAVTRQSMAAFLYRYAGSPEFVPPLTPTFPDVPTDHPFFTEVEWLASTGVADGFDDGMFRPGATITRQSMAAFFYRVAGSPEFVPPATPTFPDVPTSHPFFAEIEWLAETGITEGFDDGTFRPTASVTRQSFAAFLHRFDDAGL